MLNNINLKNFHLGVDLVKTFPRIQHSSLANTSCSLKIYQVICVGICQLKDVPFKQLNGNQKCLERQKIFYEEFDHGSD